MGFARLKVGFVEWLRRKGMGGIAARASVLLPLLCVVIGSAWLRAEYVTEKRAVNHDEAISLMAAAGRLDEYQSVTERTAGRWVDASELLLLTTVDPGGFGAVREAVSTADIHPPFYFWLIHEAARLDDGRVLPGDGVLVNGVAHVFGVVLLYLLSLRLFRSHAVAAVTAALWTFSSSTLSTTATVRQYEVLAVTAIATTLCLLGAITSRRVLLWCAAFCFAIWAALSTQLQAVALLFYAAVMLVALMAARRGSDSAERVLPRVLGVAGAASLACVLAYWAFPRAIYELTRRLDKLSPEVPPKAEKPVDLLQPIGAFFGQSDGAAQVVTLALIVTASGFAVYHGARLLRGSSAEQRERDLLGLFVPIGFLVVTLLVARQQSAFGRVRGLGTRYWAITFPFCALVVGQALAALRPRALAFAKRIAGSLGELGEAKAANLRATAVALLYVALAAGIGAIALTRPPASAFTQSSSEFASLVPLYDRVVIDNTNRGSAGKVLPFLDPNARVFLTAGAPEGADLERLRAELRKLRSVLFVDLPRRGTSKEDRLTLLSELKSAGFKVEPATHTAALQALSESVVFLASSAAARKSSKATRALLSELGATQADVLGGFVGVLDSGQWVAERAGENVALSSRRLTVAGIPDFFRARARSVDDRHLALIEFGSRAARSDATGLVAAVWDRPRARLRFLDKVGANGLEGMYAARK